jgi:hypothetical protein
MLSDGTRLILVIVSLKDQFLARGHSLSHEQIDARELKAFWALAAKAFNSNDPFLDVLLGDDDQVERYKEKGLNPVYSGYVATGEVLELKYKDLRKDHMAIQPDFRKSGQGDGWAGDTDAQGIMTIEASMTVHSSKYSDFCRSKPILWFFYNVLLVYNLLASACSFLPAEATSSSTNPGQPCAGLVRGGGGGGGPSGSARKRAEEAASFARAIASELTAAEPAATEEERRLEQRRLEAATAGTEARAASAAIQLGKDMHSAAAATWAAAEGPGVASPERRKLQKRAKKMTDAAHAETLKGFPLGFGDDSPDDSPEEGRG